MPPVPMACEDAPPILALVKLFCPTTPVLPVVLLLANIAATAHHPPTGRPVAVPLPPLPAEKEDVEAAHIWKKLLVVEAHQSALLPVLEPFLPTMEMTPVLVALA